MKRGRSTREGRALIRQAEECAKHFTASAAAPKREKALSTVLITLAAAAMAAVCYFIYAFVF